MALPLATQGFTAMADALAIARGSWVGWSSQTKGVRNLILIKVPDTNGTAAFAA